MFTMCCFYFCLYLYCVQLNGMCSYHIANENAFLYSTDWEVKVNFHLYGMLMFLCHVCTVNRVFSTHIVFNV